MSSPENRVLSVKGYKELMENSYALSLPPSHAGNYLHEIREKVRKLQSEQPHQAYKEKSTLPDERPKPMMRTTQNFMPAPHQEISELGRVLSLPELCSRRRSGISPPLSERRD